MDIVVIHVLWLAQSYNKNTFWKLLNIADHSGFFIFREINFDKEQVNLMFFNTCPFASCFRNLQRKQNLLDKIYLAEQMDFKTNVYINTTAVTK